MCIAFVGACVDTWKRCNMEWSVDIIASCWSLQSRKSHHSSGACFLLCFLHSSLDDNLTICLYYISNTPTTSADELTLLLKQLQL